MQYRTDNTALFRPLNRFVHQMVNTLMPMGFDVTADAQACDTLDKIKAIYYKTGRILVWSGASDSSIFGDADTNIAFRAWHDWGHIHLDNAPFDRYGELKVLDWQQWLVDKWANPEDRGLMKALLDCEIRGQLDYEAEHGQFPEDQIAFSMQWMEDNYGRNWVFT